MSTTLTTLEGPALIIDKSGFYVMNDKSGQRFQIDLKKAITNPKAKFSIQAPGCTIRAAEDDSPVVFVFDNDLAVEWKNYSVLSIRRPGFVKTILEYL